ncbi:MAG: methyl-accepting chemotaxis protein [Gammaproteobacteria bacterium]|nr:methyl-accepting chemotaxis protein [Gammaproteobacteria bacterium]
MSTFLGLGLFSLCICMVFVTLLYYRLRSHFARGFHRLFNQLPALGQTLQAMDKIVSDTQHETADLAVATAAQAHKIAAVRHSVGALCSSMDQVSATASASVAVALESVNIAAEGGIVVRSTISGMERIQSQIQETSNYMRRLSDSSQEIGEIVSLIDGIADQTNILSLNAAIQAAMAGEAGRGFAVVADEVQRLAEKVSYATKEIGSLVRSIQTDTNQVIIAMDQTKTQVLEGVHSAQDAGSTLEKIETVSRRLSDLIQKIAVSASDQVLVSGTIAHTIEDVKNLSEQTASGSITTGHQIDKLNNLLKDFDQLIVALVQTKDSFK